MRAKELIRLLELNLYAEVVGEPIYIPEFDGMQLPDGSIHGTFFFFGTWR